MSVGYNWISDIFDSIRDSCNLIRYQITYVKTARHMPTYMQLQFGSSINDDRGSYAVSVKTLYRP